MNREENKFDYGTLLIPPVGFELTQAIGTTYSLDLKALLSVPISFHFRESLEPELIQDPFSLFLSLKDTAQKIDVFCQLGGIHDNVKSEKLYRFVERCVHEINLSNGKSFHPKIWAVRYDDKKNKRTKYKFIVLSRNLTFDQSWDMVVSLEGDVGENIYQIDKETNQPIADFLTFLYDASFLDTPKDFIRDLLKVTFRPVGDQNYSKIKFTPLGIAGYQDHISFIHKNHEKDPWDEIVIVSPFVSNSIIKTIKRNAGKLHLISRQYCLEGLNQSLLQEVPCYHINDKIVSGSSYSESEEDIDDGVERADILPLYDLHAKGYLLVFQGGFELMLGSANATDSAFNGNVEFMVSVIGYSRNAVQLFQETYFNESNDFLTEYKPDLSLKPPKDDETEKLLDNEMKHFLSQLKLIQVEAAPQEKNLYALNVNISPDIELSPDCSIYLRPFHLPNEQNKKLSPGIERILFDSIEIADLSVFFVVTVHHNKSNNEKRCIVKMNIANLPNNREEYVVRSLLSNKRDFFKLLKLLLSDNLIESIMAGDKEDDNEGTAWKFLIGYDMPIFELLMKSASRDIKKLEEIKKVMRYLKNDDAKGDWQLDKEVLDFMNLWNHFEQYLPQETEHGEAN